MALLSDNDRRAIFGDISQRLSKEREPVAISKQLFLATVAAADQWVEDNKVSFNLALPAVARQNLTTSQKAELLAKVALKRFGG